MLLVAGGQLDPNIGALLRECLARRVAFRDILIGPDLRPAVSIHLDGRFLLEGEPLAITSCFVRHDVFLAQKTGAMEDSRAALNWFHAVRDWAASRPDIRLLNRHARSADEGKFGMLVKATALGLRVPRTMVSTSMSDAPGRDAIRKPVAGGELTEHCEPAELPYPYFLQERLARPELRIYRVGSRLFGFHIESPDLDYRKRHDVTLSRADVPDDIAGLLVALCDELGLDFAAADFMRSEDGSWVFLEVNSQPMFAAFDRITGGEVSGAILDWLLG
jgi:hypothetical protein